MAMEHSSCLMPTHRVLTRRVSNDIPPSEDPLPQSLGIRPARAARIRQQVQLCLESSSYSPIRALRCRVVDGSLVIQGHVPSYHLKQVAQELVRALKPIDTIVNDIRVTDNDNR